MIQRVRACRGAQIESILISTRPAVPSLPIRVRHLVHVQTNGRGRRGPLPSSPSATWESWLSLQDDGDGDRATATDSRRQLRFYGEISRLMSIDGGERCRLPSLVCSLGSAARSPAPANGNIIGPSNLFQRRDGSGEISASTRWKAERPRGWLPCPK